MKIAEYDLSTHLLDRFRLDGGAMFGSIPKNLWQRKIEADSENCIALASRSLLLKANQRTILIDVGLGTKWNQKQKDIFAIQNSPVEQWGFNPDQVTDIIITHLHFDHAGGISKWESSDSQQAVLSFPSATIHLQAANLKNAKSPNPRERASYLPEIVTPLEKADLNILDGNIEIFPGIKAIRCDGHTIGQQWIEIEDDKNLVMFATDVIPTSHHLDIPFNMGYDICAQTLMQEKEVFLSRALERNAIVVFQHDLQIAAAYITKDNRDRYCVKQTVEF